MKNVILSLIVLVISLSLSGQVPESFNYQAIPRNASGGTYPDQAMKIQISILSGSSSGSPVYTEIFDAITTTLGLLNLQIGKGTPVFGNFGTISWGSDSYYLKVAIDPTGGSNYVEMGVTQLLSVPYALFAKSAENGFSGKYTDLTDKPTTLSGYGITDGINISHPVNDITSIMISNWNTAFGWGNHETAGYLKVNQSSAAPSVSDVTISEITYTSVKADGNVLATGGEVVLSRGVCLSKLSSPSLNDTVYLSGNGGGTYSINIGDLHPNTTYFLRTFATNVIGTSYGNEISFITRALTLPALTTSVIYNISHTNAMSGGNVTDNGGSDLLEKGICWSTNPSPTISDNKDAHGTAPGTFNALMSSLIPNTLYYIKAYATNSLGTTYGNELSFTTLTLSLASITTSSASAVSYTTATSGGNVTSDNGSVVTSRGVCWSTTPVPTTANSIFTQGGGVGSFTANLAGLAPATKYYIRAFAINGAGTIYGNEFNFTTLALSAPALTTKSISGISSNIAASGGTISSNGGSNITAKGVVWNINPSPTLSNSFTNDGTGSASYNSTLTGLNKLTLYYVRAYATNSIGTTYGNELSFTTTDLVNPGPSVPTVGTSSSAITGSTTASSGGYVSADGGSEITARGVCWSTNQNPTLTDNYTTDGTGIGYYTSSVTGLSGCGTIYYIRAYAVNSTGTSYGNQTTVSTGLLPTVTTNDPINISFNSATCGGVVTDDGSCPIIQKGICWNWQPNPTTGNWNTTEGAGSDPYTSNLSNLLPNRTYYVRAYVTNSKGTTYGEEKVLTTTTPSALYIGQNYAGGIIFYLDGTGEHGLVCASADQGVYAWGCNGTDISGTSTAFGTGAANTAAILAGCSESNTAAKICDNLVLNLYSDWFLSSLEELRLMYNNLHVHGLGSFAGSYLSSSQYNVGYAYIKQFLNGYDSYTNKYIFGGYDYKTRAVRAF